MKYYSRSALLLLAFIAFVLTTLPSCKKDDTVPAYVYIPSISVTSTPAQGSSSSKVVDAWVYIDNQLQGAYKLPATFPVRSNGSTKLRILPGILVNGIAATRITYPFYTDTTITANLVPGQTDTIFPQVHYESNSKFAMNESFNTGNPFTNMALFSNSPDVFEAPNSAKFVMPDSAYVASAVSTKIIGVIPYNSSTVFLEMNYKCNVSFTVGLNIYTGSVKDSVDKIVLSPKTDWNKIYINFTPEVNNYRGNDYELVFSTSRSNLSDSVNIFFDNIKLIYY